MSRRVLPRLASTASPTKIETAALLKLSEALPSAIDAKTRDRLCTKFWMSLNRAERKEILDAFETVSKPVQKSPDGSPINFVAHYSDQSNASPLDCWVDASTAPACIAVLVDKSFTTFTLKDGWNSRRGLSNNWAEAVGLELVARVIIALGHTQVHAHVKSDHAGAIQAFSGCKSKIHEVNESMGRLQDLLAASNVKMNCIKVPSKENIADAFTRGKYDPEYRRLDCNIPLPEPLNSLMYVAA